MFARDVLLFFFFFFSSRRRHTRSVSAFLLNRSSDLTESLVDGERSQSKSFSSCARIGRIFSFSASSPLRFNSTYPCAAREDRKSGSAGMPRPSSYAVFCLKKKKKLLSSTLT